MSDALFFIGGLITGGVATILAVRWVMRGVGPKLW